MKKLLLIAVFCMPMLVQAEQKSTPAHDAQGAVLCRHDTTLVVHNYAATYTDNTVANSWLTQILDDHRAFVARNGPATPAQLDAFEAENLPDVAPEKLCADPSLKMFFDRVSENQDGFSEEIAQSLSVDRTPIWNPCL